VLADTSNCIACQSCALFLQLAAEMGASAHFLKVDVDEVSCLPYSYICTSAYKLSNYTYTHHCSSAFVFAVCGALYLFAVQLMQYLV
jgi:hypothetical protein